MKLKFLFVFVLYVQLVFGTETCSLTCQDAIDMASQFDACEEYTYKVTTTQGTFDEVREECLESGGDLLQGNIGPEGIQYHSEIYQIAMEYTEHGGIWIGYTDRLREGSWRFINGKAYDATNREQSAVAYWGKGEPNDQSGEDCAKIMYWDGVVQLIDVPCELNFYGLCEIKFSRCSP